MFFFNCIVVCGVCCLVFIDLLGKMLRPEKTRIDITEVMNHPYISGIANIINGANDN